MIYSLQLFRALVLNHRFSSTVSDNTELEEIEKTKLQLECWVEDLVHMMTAVVLTEFHCHSAHINGLHA